MALRKLQSTDGFVVVDFQDAPAAGPMRRAKKILQSSAGDLARSATYTFASFEMERSGASGGLNAEGDAIDGAVEAMLTEVHPDAESGSLHLYPGKGLTAEQLAPLTEAAGLPPLAGSDRARVASIVTAAAWACDGTLDGKTVAVEQSSASPVPAGLTETVEAAGATIVEVDGVDTKPWLIWGADVDVILAGTKPGTLSHQGAGFVRAGALVPWGPIPFTTKAVAMLLKGQKTTVVPDFISTAGGLVAGYLPGDEAAVLDRITASVAALLAEVADHEDGPLLASCYRAESFMAGWQGKAPFGRPLAA
ncbi:MAG: hypothetical protein AAF531_13410 [Actinomycetota bacterium]